MKFTGRLLVVAIVLASHALADIFKHECKDWTDEDLIIEEEFDSYLKSHPKTILIALQRSLHSDQVKEIADKIR